MNINELQPGVLKQAESKDAVGDPVYDFLILWHGMLLMVEMVLVGPDDHGPEKDWLISVLAPTKRPDTKETDAFDALLKDQAKSIDSEGETDVVWFARRSWSMWAWRLAERLDVHDLLEMGEPPHDHDPMLSDCPLCNGKGLSE